MWSGVEGWGGRAVGSIQRPPVSSEGKNKNIDRACRQTRTDAAEDFTGLKDVIPLCAYLTAAGSGSAERGLLYMLSWHFPAPERLLFQDARVAARIWRKSAL